MLNVEKSEQLRPGDGNCENFYFVPQPHQAANAPAGVMCIPGPCVLYENDLTPGVTDTFRIFTCPLCGATEDVYIPLNSDFEEG